MNFGKGMNPEHMMDYAMKNAMNMAKQMQKTTQGNTWKSQIFAARVSLKDISEFIGKRSIVDLNYIQTSDGILLLFKEG